MEEIFDFEHINLIPKKCIVDSRSECDTSIQFGKHTFRLPIIPANMECVINEEIAENIEKNTTLNLIFCQIDISSNPSVSLVFL